MSQLQKRWLRVLIIIIITLIVDALSKQAIIDRLVLGESIEPVPALDSYFRFTLSYNTGAAFGLLPEASNIFLIVAIVVVIGMLFLFNRIPEEAEITRFAVGLIVGGALGNALDRIQHGHVIDFIHYRLPQLDLANISNLADHAIVLGVILVFFDTWRLDRAEKQAQAAETPAIPQNSGGADE